MRLPRNTVSLTAVAALLAFSVPAFGGEEKDEGAKAEVKGVRSK